MKKPSSYVPDEAVFARLRAAAHELAVVSDDELLVGLGAALALWKGPRGLGADAAAEIASVTGMSEAMLAFGLRRTISAHSRPKLARWLAEARAEAGAETRLDRGTAGRGAARDRAPRGPEVVVQILAGNVAGLAIPATLEALLARSAVLLKPAAEEPVTARLFKESLDRAAPVLGRAVAVAQWKGGDEAVEREVFAAVGLVVASGGAEMVRSVTARVARASERSASAVARVRAAHLDRSCGWWLAGGSGLVVVAHHARDRALGAGRVPLTAHPVRGGGSAAIRGAACRCAREVGATVAFGAAHRRAGLGDPRASRALRDGGRATSWDHRSGGSRVGCGVG